MYILGQAFRSVCAITRAPSKVHMPLHVQTLESPKSKLQTDSVVGAFAVGPRLVAFFNLEFNVQTSLKFWEKLQLQQLHQLE